MLDIPLATGELRLERPVRDGAAGAVKWRPRLVLAPVWRLNARARVIKRLIDSVCALSGLIVLMPLFLLIAVAIRVESPGPVLFRQKRVGLHDEPFVMLKFRTMYHAGPGPLRQATRGDPRVTRAGRLLRRGSLDELPQLWNVLIGEMSLVGPRPHAPGTRAGGRLFEEVTRLYAARHCVKPGMTGLAQMRGWRGETDTEDKLLARIECDLEYIATWSAWLDLRIIAGTARLMFRSQNVW